MFEKLDFRASSVMVSRELMNLIYISAGQLYNIKSVIFNIQKSHENVYKQPEKYKE